MATVTVRNLPDPVHRALRARAAQHGRSTEAEIRHILETTTLPPERVKLGTRLYEIGRKVGLTDEEAALFDSIRDNTPARAMEFE